MPYSWCTTRSPSAISVASAMNWSARLRRRGGRQMRSPSRSCSPTRAMRSATKPRSTPSVTSDTEPAGLRRIAAQVVFLRRVLEVVLAQQVGDALARAAGPGGDDDAAAFVGPALGLGAQLVEHVDARGRRRHRHAGPLGEDRPRPAAAIDTRPRPSGRAKGLNASNGPPDSIASQPARSRYSLSGGSGRYGTSPSRGMAAAGGEVVGDHLQPGGQHLVGLVVQADRGARQVVQQRLHRGMEQRHPVLHAGMAAAVGDRVVDRVVGGAAGRTARARRSGSGRWRRGRAAPPRPGAGSGAGGGRRCAGWRGRRRGSTRWCRRTGPGGPGRARRRGTGR